MDLRTGLNLDFDLLGVVELVANAVYFLDFVLFHVFGVECRPALVASTHTLKE